MCPAACAPSPEPDSSARYAATSARQPNTGSTSSTPSSCSPRDVPGSHQQLDCSRLSPRYTYLTSYYRFNRGNGCEGRCAVTLDGDRERTHNRLLSPQEAGPGIS